MKFAADCIDDGLNHFFVHILYAPRPETPFRQRLLRLAVFLLGVLEIA